MASRFARSARPSAPYRRDRGRRKPPTRPGTGGRAGPPSGHGHGMGRGRFPPVHRGPPYVRPGGNGAGGGGRGRGRDRDKPPQPPPPPGTIPPPALPTSEAERQAAQAQFQSNLGGINEALYRAALSYGDFGPLQSYVGTNPDFMLTGPVVENPNSALATIARQEPVAKQVLGEEKNTRGTYFSGGHLKDLGQIEDQVSYARADALQQYLDAEAELARAYAQSRQDRDAAMAHATAADLEAFLNTPPVPKSPDGKGKGKKPPKKKKPPKGKGKGKGGGKGKGKGRNGKGNGYGEETR